MVVRNGGFHGLFPGAIVTNAPHIKSDHRPVVLETEGDGNEDHQHAMREQFEARWLKEEEVMTRVIEAWERTPTMATLAERTSMVHTKLHEWDCTVLKSPQHRIKMLKEELEQLRLGPLIDESADRQ